MYSMVLAAKLAKTPLAEVRYIKDSQADLCLIDLVAIE